jgi:NADH:ubiquinone oxidoreductase subunit F (NADH-binding)/(2Fe-2S) ferredoxin
MVILPGRHHLHQPQTADIPELVEEHLIKGRIVEKLLYREPGTDKAIPTMQDIPSLPSGTESFKEPRIDRSGKKIEEYIARDGYAGMAKALTRIDAGQIVQEMLDSGLRGRGGAGFPTGLKWKFAAQAKGDVKYVLCNADEGDPGAFMDRSVLEADPHAVLEGMVIAAKAIGSHSGYIYCRAEYPLAIHRLNESPSASQKSRLLARHPRHGLRLRTWKFTRAQARSFCGEKPPS